MALVPQFTQQEIRSRIDAFIAAVEKRQIIRLKYLGEQCVQRARINGDYMDQTGNLRSSIGYILFKNGVAISQAFEQVLNASEGVNTGKELAIKIGSKYNNGLSLVVVAGMNYALAVESKGRDVLTSTELFAQQEMPKILEQLKNNMNSALGI